MTYVYSQLCLWCEESEVKKVYSGGKVKLKFKPTTIFLFNLLALIAKQ